MKNKPKNKNYGKKLSFALGLALFLVPFLTQAANVSVTGITVTPRAELSGVPVGSVQLNTLLNITVGGDYVTEYQYKIDNSPYSATLPISTLITDTLSSSGTHTLSVIGGTGTPLNLWQSDTQATIAILQVSGGGGVRPSPTLGYCGDGIIDTGEACDDGNGTDTDFCSNACILATCTDGIQNQDEIAVDCGGLTCNSCSVVKTFLIKAVPQKIMAPPSGSFETQGYLSFLNQAIAQIILVDPITTGIDGSLTHTTSALIGGTYDISYKAAHYLSRKLTGILIDASPDMITLDYTLGGTSELIAGDLKEDDSVNALDMTFLLNDYGKTGFNLLADMNRDQRVNSSDMALIILNYFKKGETL